MKGGLLYASSSHVQYILLQLSSLGYTEAVLMTDEADKDKLDNNAGNSVSHNSTGEI